MKVVEEVNKQVADEIKDGEFRIVAKERSLEKTVEYIFLCVSLPFPVLNVGILGI
jgi:hypothetical protein